MNLFTGRNRDADREIRLWTQWEKERVGRTKKIALKHLNHHMLSGAGKTGQPLVKE